MSGSNQPGLLGHVSWDGSVATSERVILQTNITNRRLVDRNQFVRIDDPEGARTGFLARVVAGPFFYRSGTATVGGTIAGTTMDCVLLAELEVHGEIFESQPRDTNSRPGPGSSIYALDPGEVAKLHGFEGDMILGHLAGQEELAVALQSKSKGVLPRNLGIFGTV